MSDASSPPKTVLDLAPSLQRGFRLVDAGELYAVLSALATGQGNITAAGATAQTATVLKAANNTVTVAAAGTGVSLPKALPGMVVRVANNAAGALLVYPLPPDLLIPEGTSTPGAAASSEATLTTGTYMCTVLGVWQRLNQA
jgi:hypothetical protein